MVSAFYCYEYLSVYLRDRLLLRPDDLAGLLLRELLRLTELLPRLRLLLLRLTDPLLRLLRLLR